MNKSGPVASKHGKLRSLLNAGSMALGNTTGWQRHIVGKGGGRSREGERTRGAGETRNGHETATGEEGKSGGVKGTKGGGKEAVGGERARALEVLQRRKCRLNLALTISGTGETEGWNRRSREWPRPTLTWAFSRIRSVLTGSTPPSRPGTAS